MRKALEEIRLWRKLENEEIDEKSEKLPKSHKGKNRSVKIKINDTRISMIYGNNVLK